VRLSTAYIILCKVIEDIAVRGIDSLSEEELRLLSRGAQMWEKGSTAQKRSLGILGDLMNIIAAVSG